MSDRSVGIDFVARDEVSGVIRTLRHEIAGLQTSLAESTVALSRGNAGAIQSMDYLRQRIAGVTSEMQTLQAVMSRNTGMTIKIPGLDQQSDIIATTKATEQWISKLQTLAALDFPNPLATSFKPNVDQLIRDAQAQEQAINRGIVAAEKEIGVTQRLTQAQKEFDLQRRVIIASEIGAGRQKSNEQSYQESVKSIQEASREWDKVEKAEDAAALAASRGYQQATIEIEKQAQAAQRLKNIDLERRADIAQQLAGWRQLTPEQQKAAQESGKLTGNLRGATSQAQALNKEIRHIPALFDEANRHQIGQMFSTFGAMLRDSGVGTGGLLGGLGGLIAVGVVGKAAQELVHYNLELEHTAELAQNAGGAIGVSQRSFMELSAEMQLVGGSSKDVITALETIQKRMLSAVKEPEAEAAQAFRHLGISWEELRKQLETPGGSVNVLTQLGTAFKQMGDTPARTALFGQLLDTREYARIIPLLRRDLEELKAEAEGMKAVPGQDTIEALNKSVDLTNKLDTAFTAWKLNVLGSAGMFDNIKTELTSMLTELSTSGELSMENKKKLYPPMWGSPDVKDTLFGGASISGTFTKGLRALGIGGVGGDTNQILRDRDTGGENTANRAGNWIGEQVGGIFRGPMAALNSQLTGAAQRLQQQILASGEAGGGKSKPDFASPPKSPIDFDLKASEQAYQSQLQLRKTQAELIQDKAAALAIDKASEDFARMTAKQKEDFLTSDKIGLSIGKAQADQQTKISSAVSNTARGQKDLREQQDQTRMAALAQQEVEAKGVEDRAKIIELRKQERDIIVSSQYKSPAEKMEAETRLLQAQIDLRKQNLQILQEAASTQDRVGDSIIRQAEAQNEAAIERKGGSKSEAYQADIAVIKEQYSIQTDIIQQEVALAEATKNTAEQIKAKSQLLATIEAEQTKIIEIEKKMAEEIKAANEKAVAPLKSFFSSAGGAFETFLDAGISKTETFKKAAQQLVTSLTKDLVKGVGGVISEKIAGGLGGKAGEGISGLLADKLGGLVGLTKAVPKATGDAALTASATSVASSLQALNGAILQTTGLLGGHGAALTTDTSATTAGAAIKTTSTGVEQGLTGAKIVGQAASSSNTAAMLTDTAAVSANATAQAGAAAGSAASGAAGGISGLMKLIPFVGGFFQQGGIVPSAAGGMVVGGGSGGQLSILHPREMVLPEHISTGIQAMIHRGGVGTSTGGATLNYNANVTGYHPYASRSSFESMLRTHGGAMRSWVDGMARNRAFG